MLDKRDVKEKR